MPCSPNYWCEKAPQDVGEKRFDTWNPNLEAVPKGNAPPETVVNGRHLHLTVPAIVCFEPKSELAFALSTDSGSIFPRKCNMHISIYLHI